MQKDTLNNQDSSFAILTKDVKIEHIFSNHQLVKKNKEPIGQAINDDVWTASLLTLVFIFLVIFRVASEKKYLLILKSFFSFSSSRQLLREDYRINKGTSILLILIFLIGFAFFLLKINYFYNFYSIENSLAFYFIILLILLIVYSFKFMSLISLSSLFNSKEIVEEYINHIFFSIKGIGVFIFPLLVLLEFSKLNPLPIVILGLFICLFFYSIRVSRGIILLMNNKLVSFSHIFLYFCSLEILPLIVLIKLIISGYQVAE
jgi:hypothetical protein